jgi:hypothetical protein
MSEGSRLNDSGAVQSFSASREAAGEGPRQVVAMGVGNDKDFLSFVRRKLSEDPDSAFSRATKMSDSLHGGGYSSPYVITSTTRRKSKKPGPGASAAAVAPPSDGAVTATSNTSLTGRIGRSGSAALRKQSPMPAR